MFQGTGFGASTSATPFGQSTFGKPAGNTFGTPQVFGNTNTLFGQTTQPQTTGLFGSTTPAPTFGQQQTTAPSFGGFSNTTGGGGLFGTQQNAPGTSTGLFGSSGTTAFGQAKPSFGFGATQTATPGLFGQQQPAQPAAAQPASIFGQPAAQPTTGLFGATPSPFGGTTAGGHGGTTMKFTPLNSTDTMTKGGVTQTINTRHQCITCMKEYESKSLEELRFEDYAANRKGPQQGAQTTGGLFGAPAQPSLFNTGTANNQMTSNTTGGLFGSSGFNTAGSTFNTTGGGLFGKSNTTTASVFGTTNTPSFGLNTANAATTNPFGANTNQVKPFAATAPQQNTSIFGSNTQQTSLFGTANSGFGGFGTQNNQGIGGGGLFSQNKPAFATPTSSFSFPTATTNTGAAQPLFGAKPATTGGFGSTGFGTPATNAAPAFGTNFGQQNNQSSLFGSFNKPATNTNFSFPTAQPATTFGSTLNLGSNSLFGNTANKPGGLMGQPNTGGGLFSSNMNSGGNLFGKPTGFGTTTQSFDGSSMFGNNAAVNQPNNNLLNQNVLTLASVPFGDSPLFKNLLPLTGKTDELLKPTSPAAQKALMNGQNFKVSPRTGTKIKVKPIIGQSNLTKKSLFDGLKEDDISNNWEAKPSPKRLVLKLRQEGFENLRQLNATTDEDDFNIIQLNSPRFMHSPRVQETNTTLPSQSSVEKESEENSAVSKNLAATGSSPANTLQKSVNEGSSGKGVLLSFLSSSNNKSPDTSVNETNNADVSHNQSRNSENKENEELSSEIIDLEESVVQDEENQPPHPTGIRLHRVGYYTIPHLDELPAMMDSEGRCIVENFTIGRLNYGNVFYPDSFDVSGLNLDEIVHIRHKEVVVYPDDNNKPPVGQGLNRRAQVTLDRVWPLDKSTHNPISDPEKLALLDYETKLRNVSARNKTRFVEYRPQTGSWVFKVDHFSKYGLSDSDEEETPIPSEVKKMKLNNSTGGPPLTAQQLKEKRRGLDGGILHQQPTHHAYTNGHSLPKKSLEVDDEDEDMCDALSLDDGPEASIYDGENDYGVPTHKSPSEKLANDLGASSHKVQLMKQTFYQDEDDGYNYNYMEMDNFHGETVLDVDVDEYDRKIMERSRVNHQNSSLPLLRTQFRTTSNYSDHEVSSPVRAPIDNGIRTPIRDKSLLAAKPTIIRSPMIVCPPPLVVVPQSLVLHERDRVVPWKKSSSGRLKARCLADLVLNMGHRFKVGWGPSCSLITLTTEKLSSSAPLSTTLLDVGKLLTNRHDDDFSPFFVQRLQLKGGESEDSSFEFQDSIEPYLEIALEFSKSGEEENCPIFTPQIGNAALHEYCKINHTDPVFETVWQLCLALWGSMSDSIAVDEDTHQRMMDRKNALSNWLEVYVSQSVKEDLAEGSVRPERADKAVFTLLTGHQIFEACKLAQDNDNHYESLIVSQVGTGVSLRTLVEKQLFQWVETQADLFIDPYKLKLYMLVAGIPVLEGTEYTLNICENIDWKRAFALHLWYICSSSASITDALLKYEEAFQKQEPYACIPIPYYSSEWETDSGNVIFDVCYHLLRLFSFKSHPLEKLLNPATHTSDPLDYRLSWLLLQVLEALGYTHLSELSAANIHINFAAQLESHGLWHWAVFILLHLKNHLRRQSAVIDMIGRHVTLNSKNSLSHEEMFLLEKLKVPKTWLFQAKATLALSFSRYDEAAVFLIEAEEWNKSHEVIMQHIAPKAIINDKFDYLENLLKGLGGVDRERCNVISGWAHQGALLWDYLLVTREVNSVLENRNPYMLEKVQPQLASLCSRIVLLPTPTAMHRLCQAEIAKRTEHTIYNLIVLQNKETEIESIVRLAKLMNQLPLPGDYSRQERQQLISSYLNECY